MKILFSQPANLYYAWQVEVLLENIIEYEFPLNDVEIVCSGKRTIEWERLANKYPSKFFFYPLTIQSSYPSISRPNALKQHFRLFPELPKEPILYIDCDILFLKSPEIVFNELLQDDVNYVSDCRWYLGYSYLKSKENQVS